MGYEREVAFLCLMFMSSFHLSGGAVHKVGDSAGWTIIGNVDYKQWAVSKNFQIGDVIVFEYNPQFHNVMQVTHAEYKACNASSPITALATGNDSVTIDTRGHHFFICGIPGHCQAGQKVDINVLRAPLVAPNPSGSNSPSPVGLTPPLTPAAPSPSSGAPPNMAVEIMMGWMLVLQLVCTLWFC